jgi:hypothetical protein
MEQPCGPHGSCDEGATTCTCHEGYVVGDEGVCVVDETCIEVRMLEDHCRQYENGAPAVSVFFGVDFCAGTAVTPDKFEELDLSFRIRENGDDIADNVESYATIVDISVENYVSLVVDLSASVAQSQNLALLVSELRSLVAALEPGGGDPPVYVSLTLFGRTVREIEPFTSNLTAIDAALADIAADPQAYAAQVGANGTRLFEATKKGIYGTQRIRDLRAAVTKDGVLSTGTVLVVTDGIDSSNEDLDTDLIGSTLNMVLALGISPEIDAAQLQAIGRDGTFIIPEPADWSAAFDEITERVEEYPLRSYLLAYCSSTTSGQPTVDVVVEGPGIELQGGAACNFDADAFSSDPSDVCSPELFEQECDNAQCAGLTACGACGADECCAAGSCVAPMTADDVGVDCTGQDDVCAQADQVCDTTGEDPVCADPAPLGDNDGAPCSPACAPGQGWCELDDEGEPVSCQPTLPLGSLCEFAQQCASLNCYYVNPANPVEGRRCLAPARLYDHCSDTEAICESGGYCDGSTCAPRKRRLATCGNGFECRTGTCADNDVATVCGGPAACFFSWDEKAL